MKSEGTKRFDEPKVEFVAIDDTMVTTGSSCTDNAYQTAYQMCGCSNSSSYSEAVCPDDWV